MFPVARARVDDDAGRLVDDDDGRVLVDDVEREFFGRDRGLVDLPGFHGGRLAADHHVAGARRQAVDAHRAFLDPALDARARVLGQKCGKGLVEPPPGELRGKLQAMGLELGAQPFGPMVSGQMKTRGRYTSRPNDRHQEKR